MTSGPTNITYLDSVRRLEHRVAAVEENHAEMERAIKVLAAVLAEHQKVVDTLAQFKL